MSLRSFLNQIFPGPGEANEPSQVLQGSWKEKRRSNRVEVLSDELLEVHLLSPEKEPPSAVTLVTQVKNISLRGCHLIFKDPAEKQRVQVGQSFVASLGVEDFAIPLTVEIVRFINDVEAAIYFKPPFPKELEKLEKFLEPRCLGLSLREIDPSHLQEEKEKGLRWFHGINETNLFSWFDSDRGVVVQQQLVFLDQVIEWRDGEKVKTGKIKDDRPGMAKLGWVKSELMEFDPNPNPGLLDQAKALLVSSKIDPQVKKLFLEKLS